MRRSEPHSRTYLPVTVLEQPSQKLFHVTIHSCLTLLTGSSRCAWLTSADALFRCDFTENGVLCTISLAIWEKCSSTRLLSDSSAWVQGVHSKHDNTEKRKENGLLGGQNHLSCQAIQVIATFSTLHGCQQYHEEHSSKAPPYTDDDFLASCTTQIHLPQHETFSPHCQKSCQSSVNMATCEELRCVLHSSPPKSCELDPCSNLC